MLFAFSLGSLMYIGGEKTVEKVNNTLVIGLLICFGGLVATVTPNIHTENYLQIHPKEATKAVPVMILSLVFHNVIPVIAAQLDGPPRAPRTKKSYTLLTEANTHAERKMSYSPSLFRPCGLLCLR